MNVSVDDVFDAIRDLNDKKSDGDSLSSKYLRFVHVLYLLICLHC